MSRITVVSVGLVRSLDFQRVIERICRFSRTQPLQGRLSVQRAYRDFGQQRIQGRLRGNLSDGVAATCCRSAYPYGKAMVADRPLTNSKLEDLAAVRTSVSKPMRGSTSRYS